MLNLFYEIEIRKKESNQILIISLNENKYQTINYSTTFNEQVFNELIALYILF